MIIKRSILIHLIASLSALVLVMFFLGEGCSSYVPINSSLSIPSSNGSNNSAPPTNTTAGYIGKVDFVDSFGLVHAWAMDSQNKNAVQTVFFFVDGPSGVGSNAGSTLANQPGPPTSPGAGHYAIYTLPSNFLDGKNHSLYLYIQSANLANQLTPTAFIGYYPTVAGQNYFNSTAKPALQRSCGGCHSDIGVYNTDYYTRLAKTTPKDGSSATNNNMINHAAGLVSHAGGNVCGSISSSPCLELQSWWNLEFP